MIRCPYCDHENLEGVLFCEECGHGLDSEIDPILPTRKIDKDASQFSARATWGSASISETASVILHVRDARDPITLQINRRIIFGRRDTSSPQQPDIDLTPYGALEKGVSRIHAQIDRSEDVLTLIDMGSSNGTHLNGQRLATDQPRVLRDGDEIRFGKLVAHIYFK